MILWGVIHFDCLYSSFRPWCWNAGHREREMTVCKLHLIKGLRIFTLFLRGRERGRRRKELGSWTDYTCYNDRLFFYINMHNLLYIIPLNVLSIDIFLMQLIISWQNLFRMNIYLFICLEMYTWSSSNAWRCWSLLGFKVLNNNKALITEGFSIYMTCSSNN